MTVSSTPGAGPIFTNSNQGTGGATPAAAPASVPAVAATAAPTATVTKPADQFDATPLQALMAGASKPGGPSDFDLVPGRYPNTLPLPVLLEGMGKTPEGRAAIAGIFDLIRAKTGIDAPPQVVAAVQQNPKLMMEFLKMSPQDMSNAAAKATDSYQKGKLKDPAPRAQLLPQKFDFANFDQVQSPPRVSTVHPVGQAPGLFMGDLVSDTSDAQIKANRVMAEVFQRLATNNSAPADQKFEVTFNGKAYTDLNEFVAGLRQGGYEATATFESRVANFTKLKVPVPNSNPVKYLDVPAPLMVKTGQLDPQGRPVLVPATHSELIFSFRAGPNARGPKFDADVKFFQGMSSTGFFPANEFAAPAWLGSVTHAKISGDQLTRAVKLSGAFTDLVINTSKDLHLYASGYGTTGVCNDSVALIQQATTGKADEYPLLMQDNALLGEIAKRTADANLADDSVLNTLGAAIRQLPSDTTPNAGAKRRALQSIPWEIGKEPFVSTIEARKVLSR